MPRPPLLARLAGRLRRLRAAPAPEDVLTPAFHLLYGRAPSGAERAQLEGFDVLAAPDPTQLLRRIIAATDRQVLPTPFLIRLGAQDMQWARVESVELALDTADVAVSRSVAAGAYEPHLVALFRRTLKPGMVVCDVGANVGFYSLLAAQLVGENGRVLAFEPNSENARLILMSRERNGAQQLDLHPVALGDADGLVYFSPAMGSNGGQLPGTQAVLASPQCMVVPTRRLDGLAPARIDFIKMDVEGAEAQVLAGASRLLDACRPTLTSEFSPEMLGRVSGIGPVDFLQSIIGRGYAASLLERAGGETPIPDATAFMADYGSITRIEDLVFRPIEQTT